ncbi:MAG: D-alanine--D-alanine ligase [Bacteroidetes bacterium]|nr:D-alanine--D-alanine ligase [Bacteroidota bacterium]
MKNLGLVFGGRSAEHTVSITSANSLLKGFNSQNYSIIPLKIAIDGIWQTPNDSLLDILPENRSKLTVPSVKAEELFHFLQTEIEIFFPLLHGTYGEDGTIQGLFDMMSKPYVGCGVLGSSMAMDKDITKIILKNGGIPVVPGMVYYDFEWKKNKTEAIENIKSAFDFPVFVKPANAGSSIGITKVKNEHDLLAAIDLAFSFDGKVLVEKGLSVREIEISALGNIEASVSLPGEVFPGAEFYDYEDKYLSGRSTFKIPADISEELIRIIQNYAIKAFKLLNLEGMARIDFFIDKTSNEVYLNEINTIPGFTPISMYPKMWEASGLSYTELLETLISLALSRFQKRNQISSHFTIKISG